ncbi:hypothetical protein [Dongia deserti]|uniref:hypothetical protein n=1 Tax=Dongia deserti TaxID=2268030 RepID=UPI0013C4BBAE|nr:hypothetical protein [Dongia deserti]
MTASRFNSGARTALGAAVCGALLLGMWPAPLLALSDPTPIGLPGEQPTGQPASPPPETNPPLGQSGIGGAPLPPLPAPPPDGQLPDGQLPGGQLPGGQLPGDQAAPSTQQDMQPAAIGGGQPLPAVDAGAPGLLDDSNSGLGANIWQGSSGAQLISLLPKLPAPQTQPSLRDLQLRLLLTKAPGPTATIGIDPLVPLRAERLHAMGFSTEALLLTRGAANAAPADAKGAFEKALGAQDPDTACGKVDEVANSQQILDLYWRKALLFCQIQREQNEQASLGLDLIRETPDKDAGTKDFITLASMLLGESKVKKPKLAGSPDPLLTAMMQKAGLPAVTAQAAQPPKPPGLAGNAAAARDPSLPLDKRIEAAELAFAGGLVSVDELVQLYRQAKVGGDPLTMPDSPLMRAQLYQAADQAFDPVRRAQFVQRALLNARARGSYFSLAALYQPIADRITPAQNLAWFAPEAARLMFWSGNVERGGFWLNLAQGASVAQPDVARAVPSLQILAQMAGLTGNYDADPVLAWQQAGGNPAIAERLRGIKAGLGLSGGIAPVASGEAAAIGSAAQAGRRGETVLLCLVALGGRGLANADSATLAQALGGLRAVGLEEEARRIGIEAAIVSGL